MDAQVGDTVLYGANLWRVVGANARYVWLVRPETPTLAPLRVEREQVQVEPREAAERSGQ